MGHGPVLDRPDWIGHRVAPRLEPLRRVVGGLLPSACGAPPSRYSSAAGSGEENISTATRARARHRGQCSIVIHRAVGLMLRPQRGQFRNGAARRLAAESSALAINATLSTARGKRTRHPHPTCRRGATRASGCGVGLDLSITHGRSPNARNERVVSGALHGRPPSRSASARTRSSDRPCRPRSRRSASTA
jgi:hypothetical protein